MRLKSSWWMKGRSCWEGWPWSSVGRHSGTALFHRYTSHHHHIDMIIRSSHYHHSFITIIRISICCRPHLARLRQLQPLSGHDFGKKGEAGCLVPFQAAPSAMTCYVNSLNFRHPELCPIHFSHPHGGCICCVLPSLCVHQAGKGLLLH